MGNEAKQPNFFASGEASHGAPSPAGERGGGGRGSHAGFAEIHPDVSIANGEDVDI